MRLLALMLALSFLGTAARPGPLSGGSARHFSADLEQRVGHFFACLYNDLFEDAAAVIDSMPPGADDGPMAELCRATLYQAQMMAAESDSLRPWFIASTDRLTEMAKGLLTDGGDSALAYYFLGQAAALQAVSEGRAGHTWTALRRGLAAGKLFTRAYRIDPSFHDVALGLGSYRYWKSVRTRLLNWTPLFKDERQDGLRLLTLAVDSSQISVEAARTALIWAYINEDRYAEAIRLADMMHRRYPQGMTFLWAMGEASFRAGDYSGAAETYARILDHQRTDPGNYYNAVDAAFYLSQCYRRTGNPARGSAELLSALQDEVNGWPIPEGTRRRQAKRLAAIARKGE
jgi:tetratricopeptide (TPR) repeat protein